MKYSVIFPHCKDMLTYQIFLNVTNTKCRFALTWVVVHICL